MYTLIKSISFQQLVTRQVPALSLSLIIAELFYKLHSFTLECVAFLSTWLVLDASINVLVRALSTGISRFRMRK